MVNMLKNATTMTSPFRLPNVINTLKALFYQEETYLKLG